jgi:hypothetical protein
VKIRLKIEIDTYIRRRCRRGKAVAIIEGLIRE